MNRRECASQHFGLWMAEPLWLAQAVDSIAAGDWVPVPSEEAEYADEANENYIREIQDAAVGEKGHVYYVTDSAGIATIFLQGHLTKHRSSFGGTSMIDARRAVVMADQDPQVRGIMLHVDSPGGTISGTFDLAGSVARTEKPVHTYAEDLMASAALLVGTQADHVSANVSAQVGSIGVVTRVTDYSGAMEARGVKVHVISTGKYKGLGVRGAEVTDEHLEYLQERVDQENDLFVAAVAEGRDMAQDEVEKLATGRVWVGQDAVEVGLVDDIETLDEAYARLEAALSGDTYSTPQQEGQMFGRNKPDEDNAAEEQQPEAALMARMDALDEVFEAFGDHADTLSKHSFRAGLDVDQATHMATAIQRVLKDATGDTAEVQEKLTAAEAKVGELEAECDGLKDRLGKGNPPVDDDSSGDGANADDFEAEVAAREKSDDLSRGEAIGAVRKDNPAAYEAWHDAKQAAPATAS